MVTFPTFPTTNFSLGTLKAYFALGNKYDKFLTQYDNVIASNPRAAVGDPDGSYYYDILSSPTLSSSITGSVQTLINGGTAPFMMHHYDLDPDLIDRNRLLYTQPNNWSGMHSVQAISRPLVYDPLFEDSNNHYFEGTRWTHLTGTGNSSGLRMNTSGELGGGSRVIIRLHDGSAGYDEDRYFLQIHATSSATQSVVINFGFTHSVYDNSFPLSSSYWYNPALTSTDPWVAESTAGVLTVNATTTRQLFTNSWTLEDGAKFSNSLWPDYGNQAHSHLVLWIDSGPTNQVWLNRVQLYKVSGQRYMRNGDETLADTADAWEGTNQQTASQNFIAADILRNNATNTTDASDKSLFQDYIENRSASPTATELDWYRHIDNTILSHFWGPLDLIQTYAKGGGVTSTAITGGSVPNAPVNIITTLSDIASGTADASSFRTKVWLRNRSLNDSMRGGGGGSLLDYYKQKLYNDEGVTRCDALTSANMNSNSTLLSASADSLKKLSDGDIDGYFSDVGTTYATVDGSEIRNHLNYDFNGTWLDVEYNEYTTSDSGGGNPPNTTINSGWEMQCGNDAGGGSNPFSVNNVDVQEKTITINGVLPTTLTTNNWYAVDLYLNSNTGSKTINDSVIGSFFGKLTTNAVGQHVWTLQDYPSKARNAIGSVKSTGTAFSTATCSRDAFGGWSKSFTSTQWPGSTTVTVTGLRWSDWGGDIFDSWGAFYIWDGVASTPTAIEPSGGSGAWATEMNAAAENDYYKFTTDHNGNTFETTYAWRDSGTIMFQITCTSDPNLDFYVGAGGNMGSDSNTITTLNSYSASISGVGTRTIQYVENVQSGSTTERFYVHGYPMNDVGTTWALNYNLTPNDNLHIWTGAWKGATLYFSKQYNPIAATSGDIAAGVQVAGVAGFPGELRDVYGPLANKAYGTQSNLDLYTYNVTSKDPYLLMPGIRYGDLDNDGIITSNDVNMATAILKGKKPVLALTRTGVNSYPFIKPQNRISAVLTGHHKEGTFEGGSTSLPHNRHGNPTISMGDFRNVELPAGMGDAAVADINTAMSGYTNTTAASTVVGALSTLGYTVISIPEYQGCAEQMVGATGSLTTYGTFSIDAFDSTNPIARTTSFTTAALNGFPYIGFIGFDANSFFGCGIMVYSDYSTTGTLLKDLWYPNQYRTTFGHIRDANGTIHENTSTTTRTIYSDNQQPGTNGYNQTTRFAADDGTWGIRFNSGLDGNGGPYLSQVTTDRWGCENPNGSDSSANDFYWGSTVNVSTVYKFYFFVGY